MNDPAYREEHGIVARPHEVVKQAKTFSRQDFDEMDRLRVAFYAFDNFAVLRHLARFVRSESGVKEVDFFDRLSRDSLADPPRWPIITSVLGMLETSMAPPSSWRLFLDDVARYVTSELGIEKGTALETAIAVQLAHLPAADRTLPQTLHLPHDYLAWHEALLDARQLHRDDWEKHAPRLVTYGPGELKISDPHDICGTMLGKPIMVMTWNILGWDMASPVARGTVVGSNA